MKKIARLVLGIGVAALMLSLIPNEKAASADSYGNGSNSGATAAAIVLGGLSVYGIVDLLSSPPAPHKTTQPAQ
jgi:hypothetical protein